VEQALQAVNMTYGSLTVTGWVADAAMWLLHWGAYRVA